MPVGVADQRGGFLRGGVRADRVVDVVVLSEGHLGVIAVHAGAGGEDELARRREAMDARGDAAWKPAEKRKRKVTLALKAYALMATSADKGAVRSLENLE